MTARIRHGQDFPGRDGAYAQATCDACAWSGHLWWIARDGRPYAVAEAADHNAARHAAEVAR